MANQKYLNFDLAIERTGDHYRARVLQSCAGEGSVEFALPFSALELEVFTLKIGHARRGAARQIRGSDSPELAAAKEFGAKLFGAVFQGDVYACLRASLEEAQDHEQGLRFLLRLPPDLSNLPWEYLYNPAWNQFFSLSVDTPLVRYLELTPSVRPLVVTPPLRLLVVISSPSDYVALDVEREWYDLQSALQPLVTRGVVEIERLEGASLLALQRQLRQGKKYHIFHFIGHGIFDERKQDGVLLFTDEQGRGRPLSGQDLGTLLRDHRSLRLAVLNACEGAHSGKDDPFAGAAHSLVQMGLPSVIAMQYEISDTSAILFAREFYAALADGYGVDAALGDARKAIFAGGDSVEWGTPVLFTRTLDSQIFNLAPPARPQQDGSTPPQIAQTPAPSPQPARLSDDFGSLVERAPLPSERLPKSGTTPTPQDATLTRLYEDGLSAFHLENWPRACECFQAVVQLRSDYRDAAEKLNQAQQQIDLAQRYQQAQDLLARADWPGALAILEKLTAGAPGYSDASQQLQRARHQAHLQALYADAARQSQAGEWQAVIDSFAQIARLQPDYPDPQNLLPHARQQLAAQQRAQKLAELYTNALHAMNNQRWSDAQRLLIPLVKMEPQYRDAPQLLEKARSEISRQRSSQGGARLLAWLSARRRGIAVAGLVLIGLGGVIFALTKFLPVMAPAITPSATRSITPSLTAELAMVMSPSHTPTLPPSATPSPTATLTPIRTPTITLTVTPTPPPGMVLIPAGPFQMGNPDPQAALAECKKYYSSCSIDWFTDETPSHSVTVSAFWIDKYEVTNADYAKCVADGKCPMPTNKDSATHKGYYDDKQYANYPMINVSWYEANTYCEKMRVGGRLPTEAEWEKAARGGLAEKFYPWGDVFDGGKANFCDSNCSYDWAYKSANDGYADTAPVGSYAPNGYGLYDMAGNVWEWTADWYGESYYQSSPNQNPIGPQSGTSRVVRGGSWLYSPADLRAANHHWLTPVDRGIDLGFRCVATLKSPE